MSPRLLFGYTALALIAIALAGVFGVVLRLITQDTPSPPQAKTGAGHYVVKRGDALAGISRKTGVSMDRLMELNPSLDPLALVPGQRVKLRPATPAERARARRRQRKPKPARYVVKQGDTLSGIAAKTGVPLDRLFRLNRGIDKKPIVPRQRIRLRE